MGRKKTPAPDARAMQNRIIETAEALFRGVGYAKTTVADIARALSMSPANVYRYFPAKAAINEAICERLVRRIEARCQETLARPGTAAQRLERLLFEYHRAVKDNVLKDRRLHDMVVSAMDEHWSVIQSHAERMEGHLSSLLDHGVASGEFRSMDTRAMAESLLEAVTVFIYPNIVERLMEEDGPTGDTEHRLGNLLDLVFHGLRA
ncbi:TetR family transcriptional regulator [Fundidesulfovibrio butyratiphilus]